MSNFESISIDLSLLFRGEEISRDDRIWTCDILYPKQTRYQAALHPFRLIYSVIVENPHFFFHIFIFISIEKWYFDWFFVFGIILDNI